MKKAAPAPDDRRGAVIDLPATTLGAAAVRARARRRHWGVLASFLLAVVLPSAATVGYLYLRAADQYGSSMAFAVRSGDTTAPLGLLGALTQSVSTAATDAEVVYDVVRSQPMVEAALAVLPLQTMFNRAEDDVVFRLGEARPIEDILDYWNFMTDVSFDAASGIVRFEARAFDPDDAHAIAAFVLAESGRIVNRLSEQGQDDSIRVSRLALEEAEARLRTARLAMRDFRDESQEVDPTENARAALELVAALEQQVAAAQVDLDGELALVGARSPRVPLLRQRIASLSRQIVDERARLGGGAPGSAAIGVAAGGPDRLSGVISDYEEKLVDLEFAQAAYVAARASLEQARIEARRQSRFLTPHIAPTRATIAAYPQRALLGIGVFAILTVAWMVGVMVVYNIRDRQ